MATAIDERIVAAKFDASDFEKGVNKTIKKLDELKKELNLKDAANSVKELGEKTEESAKSMSNSLEKLTDRFTNFTGMLKQKLLSGIADEIVGVFFKMTNAVKSFIKGISTDQISAGLGKYQQILTSIRVILSSDKNITQGMAYKALDDLNEYVDQTSYSLTQMTDAMSKMVSSGVELDTAKKAVEGIANACAHAGINAQDAQRAFYNLSQSYGKGKLEYTDYKSLELLNMTTKNFKDQLLEAAVEVGTLKKVSDGVYQTVNKVDKKVKAGKRVTANNLTDMMKYDFINTSVMNKLFGETYYFTEKELDGIYEQLGIDRDELNKGSREEQDAARDRAIEKAKKQYGDIAVESYLAAKEARSFTDVINTLKDVVSTGWSKTFEYLFGKLETATKFFTELTEGPLANAIYKIGEWRNAVLETWNKTVNGKGSGGEAFRTAILNITDALGAFLGMFEDLLPNEESFGKTLHDLTVDFRNTTENIKTAIQNTRDWLNSPFLDGSTKTRIDVIRESIANLTAVFSIAGKVIKVAFESINKVFTALQPAFDGLIVFFNELTKPLSELSENDKPFDQITYGVNDLITVLKPVAEYLGKILGFLGKVGAFFLQLSIDTFTESISFFADILGLIIKLITGNSEELEKGEGTLTQMAKDFEDIKNACSSGLNAVKEFFSAIITDLKKLFGLTDEAENKTEEGGVFSSLKKFFETNEFVQSAKAWVDQAIIDVSNFIKDLPNKVMKFGKNIYDTLWGLFFEEKQVDVIDEKTGRKTGKKESVAILTPLGQWANTIILKVKNWFAELPQKIINGVGKVTNWINEVFNYWFAPRDEGRTVFESKDGKWVEKSVLEVSRFDNFITEVSLAVREWFNDLPNKISKAFSSMGDFLSKIIKIIDEFLFGKKVTHKRKIDIDANGKPIFKMVTERYKTGFSKWLDGVIQEIKKFIKKIPEYIKKGIKGAGDLISTVIGALFGTGENDKDGKQAQKKVQNAVEKPFLGIDITSALEAIKGVGLELFNQVMRIFTGSENLEENEKAFADAIASGIEWIRIKAKEALDWVLEFLKKLPTKISKIFSDEADNDEAENNTIGKEILAFAEMIGHFLIIDLPETILTFVDGAIDTIDGLLSKVFENVGKDVNAEEVVEEVIDHVDGAAGPALQQGNKQELTGWEKLVDHIGQTISKIFSTLPVWIVEGINLAVGEIGKIINDLPKWVNDTFSDAEKQSGEEISKNDPSEEPALVTAIKKVGEGLKTLFVETIPGFITSAWNAIFAFGSEVWTGLSALFAGQDQPASPVAGAVYAFGNSIYNWITKVLPLKVREAIFWVKHELFKVKVDPPTTDDLFDEKKMLKQRNSKVAGNLKDEIKDDVNKAKEEANTELSNDDGSMWTFVSGIGEALKKGFADLGPAILTGLAEALAFIGNIFTFIINFLTGKTSIADQVEKAYGDKQPELRKALKKIGENLKNFFLNIVPEFIGSAIGVLAANAGEWLKKLFGAVDKTTEKITKDREQEQEKEKNKNADAVETALGSAKGVLDTIMGMFSGIQTAVVTDAVATIAMLLAITAVLKAVRDMFSITDELDSIAGVLKWTAIIVAVSAIAGIISHITSVVDDIDHPEKYEHVKELLDKLTTFMTQIIVIMGIFYGGKFINQLAENAGSKNKVKLAQKGLENGGKLISGIANGVTSLLTTLGISGGIGLGSKLIAGGFDDVVDSISDSFTMIASSMADALETMFPFIDRLVEMADKTDKAVSALGGIKDIFVKFYELFNDVYTEVFDIEEIPGDDSITGAGQAKDNYLRDTTNLSSFLLYLEHRITLFTMITNALDGLASTLEKLDKVSSIEGRFDDLMKLVEPGKGLNKSKFTDLLTKLLDGISESMDKTKLKKSSASGFNLSAEEFNKVLTNYTLMLDLVSKALTALNTSFSGLNFTNAAAFSNAMKAITDLIQILKDTQFTQGNIDEKFNNKTLSRIGYQIKRFSEHMKKFIENIISMPGFDTDELTTKTNQQIDAVVKIADGFAKAFNEIKIADTEQLSSVAEKLPEIGSKISEFFIKVNEGFKTGNKDNEMVDIPVERILALSDIIKSVSVLFGVVTHFEPPNNFSTLIDKLFGEIDGDAGTKFVASIRRIVNRFSEALENDTVRSEIEEIGKPFASQLIASIQSALDSDPTLMITPVLNTEGMKEQLRTTFGGNINLEGMSASVSAANTTPSAPGIDYQEIRNIVGEVASEVRILGDKSLTGNDLTKAFEGMAVTIDRNKLVGAIVDAVDVELGKRYGLVLRYNAVPK